MQVNGLHLKEAYVNCHRKYQCRFQYFTVLISVFSVFTLARNQGELYRPNMLSCFLGNLMKMVVLFNFFTKILGLFDNLMFSAGTQCQQLLPQWYSLSGSGIICGSLTYYLWIFWAPFLNVEPTLFFRKADKSIGRWVLLNKRDSLTTPSLETLEFDLKDTLNMRKHLSCNIQPSNGKLENLHTAFDYEFGCLALPLPTKRYPGDLKKNLYI